MSTYRKIFPNIDFISFDNVSMIFFDFVRFLNCPQNEVKTVARKLFSTFNQSDQKSND